MKKSKILGIALIASSVLIQVAYATTAGITINNTDQFDVHFSEVSYDTPFDDVNVTLNEINGATLQVDVGNLYPGAYYTVACDVKNEGNVAAKLSEITIAPKGQQSGESQKLFDSLVGYTNSTTPVSMTQYSSAIAQQYDNKTIKPGETTTIEYTIGLDSQIADLENQTTGYLMTFHLEQIIPTTDNGGGNNNNNTDNNNNANNNNNTNPTQPNEGNVEVPDENVPAGPINNEEAIVPELTPQKEASQIEVPDENVPAGAKNLENDMLPKTGGIPAVIIYISGAMMIGAGVILCKKKEERE